MEDNGNPTTNDNLAQDNGQTTTEDLRRLTQAPSMQPLITESEFSIDEARSPRPRWTQPLPKFALVGAILFPIFGIVCWFVLGGSNRYQQAEAPVQETVIAESQATPTEEMARLQEENAKLKAGQALDDQVEIEQQLRQANTQTKPPEVETQEKPPAEPEVAPTPIRSEPPPRQVAYSSPSPRIQTAPSPVSRPVTRTAVPTRSIDPMQQWQQLAQLGSYGSIRPEEATAVEFSSHQEESQSVTELSTLVSSTSSVPIARIAPTSAVQPSSSDRFPQTKEREDLSDNNLDVEQLLPDEVSQNPLEPIPEFLETQQENLVSQSSPTILEDAEAAILEGDSTPQSLIAGTSSPGILLTPIVVNESDNPEDQFAVVLSEPLMDSRGAVAFPAGTQFLVQVDNISETGQVHLSATIATWDANGHQQELILPTGVIQVRGEAGEPLMAEHYEDRGDEIAAMDAGQFLLGAIGRAAELYTRSDTRVETRGSSTVISEDNPEPNILAGLIEGGTDAILNTIQERNQRAVERLEELPNARFVEAGTPVEIFVNQSLFMPM